MQPGYLKEIMRDKKQLNEILSMVDDEALVSELKKRKNPLQTLNSEDLANELSRRGCEIFIIRQNTPPPKQCITTEESKAQSIFLSMYNQHFSKKEASFVNAIAELRKSGGEDAILIESVKLSPEPNLHQKSDEELMAEFENMSKGGTLDGAVREVSKSDMAHGAKL